MPLPAPSNHAFDQTPETLGAWLESVGMAPYRAGQVMEWLYERGVADPHAMTNLAKADRDLLAQRLAFLTGRTLAHQTASDGVEKLLIEWGGNEGSREREHREGIALAQATVPDPTRQTECVMIPSRDGEGVRRTACISSQVGCPVGCRFCASGLGGFDANLSAGRIVEQVWRLRSLVGIDERRQRPNRITNVVFMGMGEPLANFASVTGAIRTICAPWGMGISARKVTISTVGLPKYIERLAAEFDLPVTLALSLHAADDEVRRRLIPWAEYTTIEELLRACRGWFEKTGREVTLEYTLLRGVNDRPRDAERLAELAHSIRANVNLIRYNEVAGVEFQRPRDEDVREFQEVLRSRRVNAHIRASRGRDISAACGQLRHERAGTVPAGAKA